MIVDLPADAKLYVDDQLMKTTSERRVFNTPSLQQGQTYYYVLRAEVTREGQKYSDEKRVIIRPGDVVRTSFSELTALAETQSEATAQR